MSARVSELIEQARDEIHTDPSAAERLLVRARADAAARGLPGVGGQAAYLQARVAAERGNLQDALALVVEAHALLETAGDSLAAARTDLGRMQILDDLGRHHEALEVGEALLARLDEIPEPAEGSEEAGTPDVKALIRASALGNCGVVYGFLGRHAEALAAYEKAETALAELGHVDDAALWRANRGIELLQLGEVQRALALLAEAAATFRASGDQVWEAKCEAELAEGHRLTGDLVSALASLGRAQTALEELGIEAELARVHLQRGRVYLGASLWREAIAAARESAKITGPAGMVNDEAQAHYIAARALLAANDLDEADAELTATETLAETVGDAQLRARVRYARGEWSGRTGDRARAVTEIRDAVAGLRDGGWLVPAAWGMLRLHGLLDDRAASKALLAETEALVAELDNPDLAIAAAHGRARQLIADDDAPTAVVALRAVRDRIEARGSRLYEPSVLAAATSAMRRVSDDLVRLLVDDGAAGALREALVVSDRAKAQALADLAGMTTGTKTGAGIAEADLLEQMRRDLSAVYAALQDTDDVERSRLLRVRAREIEAALVDSSVRAAVLSGDVDAHDARLLADPEAPRAPGLAFHVLDDDVVAFVVDGATVDAVLLAGAYPEVQRLLSGLAVQWSRARSSKHLRRAEARLAATTAGVLAELHDVLIAPVAPQLARLTGDRLVIAPDRLLHQVPFPALYDGERHLLDRWVISLAPTTRAAHQPTVHLTGRAVVVGVPDDNAPNIEREATAVAAALPDARLLLGAEASVEAVSSAMPGAGLIHLACHGMYRPENALFSSLGLADRWWSCTEVLDLALRGAAVVLTACESGKSGDTAEPIGLAWGFLGTGAASVVVSQWLLDDEAAVAMMHTFYQRMVAGDDVDHALRTAQIAVRANHPHPYYWAPLVHVVTPFDLPPPPAAH